MHIYFTIIISHFAATLNQKVRFECLAYSIIWTAYNKKFLAVFLFLFSLNNKFCCGIPENIENLWFSALEIDLQNSPKKLNAHFKEVSRAWYLC